MQTTSPKVNELPRVKIVAVAKDEAAYFPEWVFHHFYFGVDSIDVYVNRTQDNSISMLDELKKHYPKLNYYTADWVDMMPAEVSSRIQYVCYGIAFDKAVKEKDCDYILYIDVDEFFIAKDFATSIGQLLQSLDLPECVCLQWLNEQAKAETFSSLDSKIFGQRNLLVKSAVKVSSNVKRVSFHVPTLHEGDMMLANGDIFERDGAIYSKVNRTLDKDRDFFILHRYYRSKTEYCAALVKSNAERHASIKTNRTGFVIADKEECQTVAFPKALHLNYIEKRDALLKTKSIENRINAAQKFILARANNLINATKQTKLKHLSSVYKALRGTGLEEEFAKQVAGLSAVKKCRDKFIITKCALELETVSLEAAKGLWKRAYEIHPQGPLIKRKCQQYNLISATDEIATK